jgi:helix-turn-helix protein
VFEIGNSLREARLRQQVELSEVELATKIRARYLRALEEESFEVLPAQTYVKGFLRTYADYLGLDGQLYVDEYNSRYATGEEDPREPVVARRSSHVRPQHRRLERRGVLFAVAGIGALFALVIAAWKFSDTGSDPIPNLGSGSTTQTQNSTPTAKEPKAKPAKLRLYMRAANGNSWMDIRNWSQNGRPRYTGTLELGQAKLFVARKLWINFGNPGNLAIVLNGKLRTITRAGPYVFTPRGFTRAV